MRQQTFEAALKAILKLDEELRTEARMYFRAAGKPALHELYTKHADTVAALVKEALEIK